MPEGGAAPETARSGGTDIVWHERPDFRRLTDLWGALAGGGVCSSFQTPEFLDSFFQNIAPGKCETFGVLAAHQPGASEPSALLPLIRYKKGPVRLASFPDLGVSDQNAPVLSRSLAEGGRERGQAICFDLIRGITGADLVDVQKIHGTVGETPNPLFQRPGAIDESATLYLDAEALAAAGKEPKKGVYKKAKVYFRKLQAEGVRLVEVTSPVERLEILDAMMVLREERFRSIGRQNSLKQDNRENFYRSLVGHPGAGNPTRVLVLKSDEEIVAAMVLFADDQSCNVILISIGSERWQKFSPGIVMFVQSVYWARDNGFRIYNFGTGLQAYKSRFGTVEQPTQRLLVPLTVTGWAAIRALKARKRTREILSRLTSKSEPDT